VKSNPNWRHRRRLIYSTVALAFGMIVFGAFVWRDGMVASELVRNGTILLTTVLTSYVFGAALDDKWQRADDEPSDFDSPDGSSDGDGMAA
jgi:hypothetical protein